MFQLLKLRYLINLRQKRRAIILEKFCSGDFVIRKGLFLFRIFYPSSCTYTVHSFVNCQIPTLRPLLQSTDLSLDVLTLHPLWPLSTVSLFPTQHWAWSALTLYFLTPLSSITCESYYTGSSELTKAYELHICKYSRGWKWNLSNLEFIWTWSMGST